MGRKPKVGLDYYSIDVDFFVNNKILFISELYGLQGEAITVRLLGKIYRDKGYYCKWDDDSPLLFKREIGGLCDVDLINNVIAELIKRNFFDQNLYKKHAILTSVDIQERYLAGCTRRTEVIMKGEYFLLNFEDAYEKHTNLKLNGIYDNINKIPVYINDSSDDIDVYRSTQSKVKESKVKESKIKESTFLTDFKNAYPKNGTCCNPETDIEFNRLIANGGLPNKIIDGAKDYDEYCKVKYKDKYPHCEYIMKAENFLKKNAYKQNWKVKKEGVKSESKGLFDFAKDLC